MVGVSVRPSRRRGCDSGCLDWRNASDVSDWALSSVISGSSDWRASDISYWSFNEGSLDGGDMGSGDSLGGRYLLNNNCFVGGARVSWASVVWESIQRFARFDGVVQVDDFAHFVHSGSSSVHLNINFLDRSLRKNVSYSAYFMCW